MQISGDPRYVRLEVDLTKYDSRCKENEQGWTIPDYKVGVWGSQDRFVAVRFDNGACLDVLWRSLEIIEKDKVREKLK